MSGIAIHHYLLQIVTIFDKLQQIVIDSQINVWLFATVQNDLQQIVLNSKK